MPPYAPTVVVPYLSVTTTSATTYSLLNFFAFIVSCMHLHTVVQLSLCTNSCYISSCYAGNSINTAIVACCSFQSAGVTDSRMVLLLSVLLKTVSENVRGALLGRRPSLCRPGQFPGRPVAPDVGCLLPTAFTGRNRGGSPRLCRYVRHGWPQRADTTLSPL